MKHLAFITIFLAANAHAQMSASVCPKPIIKSVTPEIDADGKLALRASGSFNGAAKSVKVSCGVGDSSYSGAEVNISAYQGRDNGTSPQMLRRKSGPRTVSVFYELPVSPMNCNIVVIETQPDACVLADRTSLSFSFPIDPSKIKGADVALQSGTAVVERPTGTDINQLDSMTELELRQTTVANVIRPTVRPTRGGYGYVKNLTEGDFQIMRIDASGKRSQLTLDKDDFSNDPSALSLAVVLDASESMGERIGSSSMKKREAAERAALTVLQAAITTTSASGQTSNGFVINFNDQNFINSAKAEKNRLADPAHFLGDIAQLSRLLDLKQLSQTAGGIDEGGSSRSDLTMEGGSRILDAVQRAALEFSAVNNREDANPPPAIKPLLEKKDALLAKLDPNAKVLPPELKALMKQIRDSGRKLRTVRPRPVIFLISDGEDNGSRVSIQKLKDQIHASGAALYMIGFMDPGQDATKNELVQLAYDTGGSALAITNYDNSGTSANQQILSYTRDVVAALAAQYELTFNETVDDCSAVQVLARDFAQLQNHWQSSKTRYEIENGLTLPAPKTAPLSLDPITRLPVSAISNRKIQVRHIGGVIAWPEHKLDPNAPRVYGASISQVTFDHRIQVPVTKIQPFISWEKYRSDNYNSVPFFQVSHRPAIGYCRSKDIEQVRRLLQTAAAPTNTAPVGVR